MNDQDRDLQRDGMRNQPRPRPDGVGTSPMQQRSNRRVLPAGRHMATCRLVFELANRYNVAIYPVDPRGARHSNSI